MENGIGGRGELAIVDVYDVCGRGGVGCGVKVYGGFSRGFVVGVDVVMFVEIVGFGKV